MILFPSHPQTLVLPFSEGKTISKIRRCIFNKKIRDLSTPIFTGYIKGGKFKLIPHQKSANNFIPVITGEVLASKKGSIIRSQYALSKNTRIFLIFVCSICLLSSFLVFLFQHNFFKSVGILAIGFINYGITLFQFNREVRKTIKTFNKVFGDHFTAE